MWYLFFVLVAYYAVRDVSRDVSAAIRKSRDRHIAGQEQTSGKPVTGRRRKAAAARHDAGWWGREVAHGFPVTTAGFQRAWTAHHTAHLQGMEGRLRAKADRNDARLKFAEAKALHKARAEQVAAKLRDLETPKAGGRRRTQPQVSDPKPPEAAPTAPAAAPQPVQPPSCISCGRPAGASAVAGQIGDGSGPLCTDCAHFCDGNIKPPQPQPARVAVLTPTRPALVPVSQPTQNGNGVPKMPSTSEFTYDQHLTAATQAVAVSEQHQADLARHNIPQLVDDASQSGLDPGSLGRLANWDDAHVKCVEAAKNMADAAQAYRDGLVRDHGNVNEAHQTAPQGGAEKSFYVER